MCKILLERKEKRFDRFFFVVAEIGKIFNILKGREINK